MFFASPTRNQPLFLLNNEDHPYQPPKPTDSRSPCPGLNILANHGYLPRDGKRLGLFQLIHAVREVWNLSFFLAFVLSFGGILLCASWFKVDLAQLALHNRIEHDASLVRDNADGNKYAPTVIDKGLVNQFLSESAFNSSLRTDVYDIQTFGKIRGIRNQQSAPNGKLDFVHDFISRANPSMILMALGGKDLIAPKKDVDQFLVQERIPDHWVRPNKIGFLAASKIAGKIKKAIPPPSSHSRY